MAKSGTRENTGNGNPSAPVEGPGRQLKQRLGAGGVLIGGMLTEYARPSLVKLYVQSGFDFLYIEYEHG
ncbi:MAG: hypothetical protein VB859_19655, partial [Planctomycetaceae bacterium]